MNLNKKLRVDIFFQVHEGPRKSILSVVMPDSFREPEVPDEPLGNGDRPQIDDDDLETTRLQNGAKCSRLPSSLETRPMFLLLLPL